MGSLTAREVRSAKAGRHQDGEGLFLCVGATGSKSWMLRIQAKGKRRDFGLGSSRDVSLGQAREKAAAMRKVVMAGGDPVAERNRIVETVPTFAVAARRVHEEHKPGWKNGKHQAQWLATLETYTFPAFGDLPLDKVESGHVRDALAAIWLTKPETARRVRQRIAAVLDWGHAMGFRASEAPMRSIARGLARQPRRDGHFAALPYSQLPTLVATLQSARCTYGRLALEALILTAARSGEIRGATWSEIDVKARLWTVPADRMKAGKVHVVPLSRQALAVLERAQAMQAGSTDLIFPGASLKRPLSDMTLLKILRDMDIKGTVHGMRSAFRDWAADATDFPSEVAEAALAHAVKSKVEAAYKRTDFLEKRRTLMETWGAYCLASNPRV